MFGIHVHHYSELEMMVARYYIYLQELLTAACYGDLEDVGWYLSLGAEINCRNEVKF